jgi:serine/threonine protein kinase
LKWRSWQTSPKEGDQLLDLLSRIFQYQPEERLPIAEIEAHPWFEGFSSRTVSEDVDIGQEVQSVVNEVVEEVTKDVSMTGLEPAVVPGMESPQLISHTPNDKDEAIADTESVQAPSEPQNGEEMEKASLTSSPVMVAAEIVPCDENEVFYYAEDRGQPAEVVVVDFMAAIFGWIKSFFPPPPSGAVGGCVGI